MDGDRRISLAVIRRLPRYYRYLGDLLDNGILRISSKDLSQRMNITASQIRQDLNNFGCFGQQGYGYNVEVLYSEIRKILGLDKAHTLALVGAGKVGQALLNYASFERRGFKFVAIFDVKEEVVGKKIRDVPVYHSDSLDKYLQENSVDIVVLTLPKEHAAQYVDVLKRNNVRGVWNFSPIDLEVPPSMLVENVHLTDSLMTLSYRLSEDDIIGGYGAVKKN